MTRTIRGVAPGSAPTPPAEYDLRDEASFRRAVMLSLQQLAEQAEEVNKRIDKALTTAVLDKVGDGHYQASADKRTEDATFQQSGDGHYHIEPDDLTGRRIIRTGDHLHIET